MLELTIQIEAGDLYDYMLRHSYNSPAGILGSTFGAVLILFALATKQWIFIVLGLVMLLHYTLDEEGLCISQGDAREKLAWEYMHKAVSTGRSIILYTSPVNGTIFPRRQLGDRQAAVIEMISTHMPPAKVKIRS